VVDGHCVKLPPALNLETALNLKLTHAGEVYTLFQSRWELLIIFIIDKRHARKLSSPILNRWFVRRGIEFEFSCFYAVAICSSVDEVVGQPAVLCEIKLCFWTYFYLVF